ncbi:MAG: hypothetical protein KF901_07410 [Myxococcales bacterium]|nr:hypothetical protein [Myxococcales bacterium]
MLFGNDIKEHLALAYVYAVATRAECATEFIRVDRDSTDVMLSHRLQEVPPGQLRVAELKVQVKAHVVDPLPSPFDYYVKRKNF